MKTLLVIFAVLAVVSAGQSQGGPVGSARMILEDVLEPNNRFNDTQEGVSFTYPKGWSVRGGERGSVDDERENTVRLDAPRRSSAYTTVYYQFYSAATAAPGWIPIEKYLKTIAAEKAASRLSLGFKDYKNDPGSFVFAREGSRAVLKNLATFTRDRKPQAEYYVRIFGPVGYVIFTVVGPVADVRAVLPDIDRMASTVKSSLLEPEGAYADSIDWFLRGN